MLKGLSDNFNKGIDRIKWFSTLLSERLRIEVAVIKLLFQSDKMEKRMEELFKIIGQRVVELKGQPEKNVLKDETILHAISQADSLRQQIDELKQKASEISRVDS